MVKHVGGGFDVCRDGFGWYLIRPLCLASSQDLDGYFGGGGCSLSPTGLRLVGSLLLFEGGVCQAVL